MNTHMYRLPAVLGQIACSRSMFYLLLAKGLWTKPVRFGTRAAAWPAPEVEVLVRARIAGQTDLQIRQLVTALERQREHALDHRCLNEG